jgi:hypothetical protein
MEMIDIFFGKKKEIGVIWRDCNEESAYLNPVLGNYECEGQMSLFEFTEQEQEVNENGNSICIMVIQRN